MLLLRLWNYIRGYVIILVEGYFLEKFINVCTHRQIFLWDIKHNGTGRMTLKISIKGFKAIRPIVKKTNCRVRILKKKGIPFSVSRYKRRKPFILGALVFLILLSSLSSFVWSVEVSGNKDVDKDLILGRLEDIGIKPGIIKYKIDTDKVVNDLMLQIKELGWVGVSVRGTKVKVQVAERRTPPQLVPSHIPCDIIADKDGIVKSIIVKQGIEKVKPGDTVIKGQVLISGRVDPLSEGGQPMIVHAIGSVVARTWYETRETVNTNMLEEVRTGKVKNKYSLIFFGKQVKLPNTGIEFENYEKQITNKNFCIGEDFVLPLGLKVEKYYENNIIEKVISIDEAKSIAANKAYEGVMGQIPSGIEVVDKNVEFIETQEGKTEAVMTVECLEEIGYTKEIGGN